MRCYVIVEGESTEPKLLRAWFGFTLPQLTEVPAVHLLRENTYFILSAKGQGNFERVIDDALGDVEDYGNVDHLVIWADAEDFGYEPTVRSIEDQINAGSHIVRKHLIVANCCTETWFLGHKKMLRQRPTNEVLREYKKFYDVSKYDPEMMSKPPHHTASVANFHYEYLKEMLNDQIRNTGSHYHYSKHSPGMALEQHYFDALIERANSTGHISSFNSMISCLKALGSDYIKN
jgi:hypothetical protein